ncbi:uncharacterized protein LOC110012324 [Sesamum indicum]|uniref:Uncharacterized protein LOC110012324 n=1 Tax=Sesamum indicum TaxID=4182 RepID=A0A8M8UX88_SESIN|nr:uncharacterized protein LOC110012324 [Sesamum indicum]
MSQLGNSVILRYVIRGGLTTPSASTPYGPWLKALVPTRNRPNARPPLGVAAHVPHHQIEELGRKKDPAIFVDFANSSWRGMQDLQGGLMAENAGQTLRNIGLWPDVSNKETKA